MGLFLLHDHWLTNFLQVRVSDIKLGGRVLQHDDVHDSGITESHEDLDHEDSSHRQGLLGTWSPPDGTTPTATIPGAQQNGGILGLALSFEDDPTEESIDKPIVSERDSGVHVDDDLTESLTSQLISS
jgi:hypothetical protein